MRASSTVRYPDRRAPAALATMAGVLLLAATEPVAGATLAFTPVGAPLDTDRILDVETSPGQFLNFTTTLDTTGLPGALVLFNYTTHYDATELAWTSESRGLTDQAVFLFGDSFNHDPGFLHERVASSAGLGPGRAASLDLYAFTVLPDLKSTGVRDFWLDVTVATVRLEDGTLMDVAGRFDDRQEVEVQPAPAPPAMLALASAIGGLISVGRTTRRRRRHRHEGCRT